MSEDKKEFETWKEVIIDFLNKKREFAEETYLKDVIKNINGLFKEKQFFNSTEIEDHFNPKKNKKDKSQSSIEFQREKYKKIFEFVETSFNLYLEQIKAQYYDKCKEIDGKYAPHKWITQASKNAASVSFATHVIKLTHSKIDSSSIYDQINLKRSDYVTTSSLLNKAVVGAVSGNQYAPIYQFLELELNGKKLAGEFTDSNTMVLDGLAQTNEDIKEWNSGFSKSLHGSELSTHSLAKQIYFPVTENISLEKESYHLLCNIQSSSLSHAIFTRVHDGSQKEFRKLRNKKLYSEEKITTYMQRARLSITASNHSNASQLNGKRGGKLILFPAQPPTWQSQLKPPIYKKSLFNNFYPQAMKTDIEYLRDFLLRFESIDLSIKNPQRMKWINSWVDNIIDEFLFYTSTIQNLPTGWTAKKEIKLKLEHQYLLDPYREDEQFQAKRKADNWQSVVCDDFSAWLNRLLIGRDKKFTPQKNLHSRMWSKFLEQPLREYSETIEYQSEVIV
jgi:CRISPR-associated protein Csy1